MSDRLTAGLAAVVTLFVGVGRTAPGIVRSQLLGNPMGVPGMFPSVGTTVETVSVYLAVLQAVGPLVTWTLVLGLGYYLARRRGAADDLLQLAVDLGTGSVTAVVVVGSVVMVAQALTMSGSVDGPVLLMVLPALAATLLSTSVPVVAGGVAVAAVTAQTRDRKTGPSRRGATTDGEQTAPPERVREHAVEDAD
jgi:hypothetical protein